MKIIVITQPFPMGEYHWKAFEANYLSSIGHEVYMLEQLNGRDLHEAMLTQAYTNNGITVGPSPGPSGHSEFQDLDKILPSGNESLGQFGGPYAYGVGPADGFY